MVSQWNVLDGRFALKFCSGMPSATKSTTLQLVASGFALQLTTLTRSQTLPKTDLASMIRRQNQRITLLLLPNLPLLRLLSLLRKLNPQQHLQNPHNSVLNLHLRKFLPETSPRPAIEGYIGPPDLVQAEGVRGGFGPPFGVKGGGGRAIEI